MRKILFFLIFIVTGQIAFSQNTTYLLQEDFSSITSGNSTATDGSPTLWGGNTNFPSVGNSRAYQAGGVIKLGSSSNVGYITTKVLDLSANSGNFTVKFKVKGWTSVEGNIKVTATSLTAQNVTYTSTISGTFEEKTLNFTGGTSNSTIIFETTAKRAFFDDIEVYYQSASNAPNLTFTNTPVNFGNQNLNTSSSAISYTINYNNLNGTDLNLNTAPPFTISNSENGIYGTSLTLSGLNGAGNATIYAKFNPTATGSVSQNISHTGGGLSSASNVSLNGTGIDPNATSFNFESCTPTGSTTLSDGFKQVSITGAQTWACTNFGRNPSDPSLSSGYALQMNGFSGGSVQNEDWLISPAFNLTATNYPILSFWSRSAFAGDQLQLKVSTDYLGTGNPNAANWVNLDGKFPASASDVWTKSDNIGLTAYKNATVYIAFVYTSNTSAASRWTVDDFSITNSSTPPAAETLTSTNNINFGFVDNGTSSEKQFTFTAANITGDVNLTSTGNFEISKTPHTGFTSNLTFTNANTNNTTQTVYVKFSPNQSNQNFSGNILLTSNGTADKNVALKGNTYNINYSLHVCNWNIEWFGSTGNGPSNVTLQASNTKSLFNSIKADVYGLAEIVDTALFRSQALPVGYNVIFSDFASYADDKNDSDYNNSQKLAFMYNTSIIKPIKVSGVLRDTYYPSNLSNTADGSPFKNWASGRFPFMLEADVTMNDVTERVYFIEIHAKANTGTTSEQIDSYNRRKNGAQQLKDWLETNLPGKKIIIMGDYNDILDPDKTIAPSSAGPGTSYSPFTTSANYNPISLSLSLAGKQSTVSYSTVIDNVIISTALNNQYINGSVDILEDVTNTISNYASTTSDHYPMLSRYIFDATTLPIQLESFNAIGNQNKIDLNWVTASEVNNNYFIIEKASDKNTFTEIGKIKGAGTSNSRNFYALTDEYPYNGNNYYRLKQVDYNGNFSYSPIKLVRLFGNSSQIIFSPNPVENQINIHYTTDNKVTIKVLGSSGSILFNMEGKLQDVKQNLNIFIKNLSTGYYIIQLVDGETQITNKILKK